VPGDLHEDVASSVVGVRHDEPAAEKASMNAHGFRPWESSLLDVFAGSFACLLAR
jgi:hypothetical protein